MPPSCVSCWACKLPGDLKLGHFIHCTPPWSSLSAQWRWDRDDQLAGLVEPVLRPSAIRDVTNPLIQEALFATDLLLGHDEDAARWLAHYRRGQHILALRSAGAQEDVGLLAGGRFDR